MLYGATSEGDEPSCGTYYGCGRIFSIDAAGKERVIYRFKGGTDGCWPSALVALKGTLYGVTQGGGTSSSCAPDAPGTVFAVTPSGKETVLHQSKGIPDGAVPNSLMAAYGVLYGTTILEEARLARVGIGRAASFSPLPRRDTRKYFMHSRAPRMAAVRTVSFGSTGNYTGRRVATASAATTDGELSSA